jgi:hypothetical protein
MARGEFEEEAPLSRHHVKTRKTTPWWLVALAILLTAVLVLFLLDAINSPEAGGVKLPYTVQ